ncbi:unnamed protein product (macronuclear) [Paramecium tetraurelia]|uniref:SRP54-type proteins GTP-binding domain-containing protein n=1 Tax=Paramecium tetraurelia TaxID=5888 RepID=A0EG60_PARTE|nr:uncharacterized protein GSPATT00026625001 [Paramecium tetraurelia]CAK94301.1 unnamed protein product [Paramecium tetraurelia]|eukprot:XP_001461674.1 hypothetical protein (macronuclear) [Paramecium tetraurelia strain d4-2]
MHNPDLIVFVGEALVGNDGLGQFQQEFDFNQFKGYIRGIDAIILSKFDTVDEKVGAGLSLSSGGDKAILLFSVGQKYRHLKKRMELYEELKIYIISKYKNKI